MGLPIAGNVNATVVSGDPSLDLAVLRLDKPVSHAWAPLWTADARLLQEGCGIEDGVGLSRVPGGVHGQK